MARDTRIQAPPTMGGITRYFDEYKSKISITPMQVVILCGVVIVLFAVLNMLS